MIKKIIIEIDSETDDKRIFKFVKDFCVDNFQKYKLELVGTELKEEFEWKKVK